MSRKASSGPLPGEVELRMVEELLMQCAPEWHQRWTSLLNAMLVEAESPEPQASVLHAIQDGLVGLLGGQAAKRGALLRGCLNDVVRLAALPTPGTPKISDGKGTTTSYSLGDGAEQLIAHLRFDLGLSVMYTSRHIRDYLGAPTPAPALLACVAAVKPVPGRRRR